jgi:hypothetical protein
MLLVFNSFEQSVDYAKYAVFYGGK